MKDPKQIAELFYARRKKESRWKQEALLLRELLNGDIDVPLPEQERNEKAAVANVAITGLNQTAKRVVSTQPNVMYTPIRFGIKASEEKARQRQLINKSWWHQNRMPMIDKKRARWLLGYGMAPIEVLPIEGKTIPHWRLRDPLTAYPAPTDYQDSISPPNCIFTYYKSFAWLMDCYPAAAMQLARRLAQKNKQIKGDDLFDILEYVDDEERVLLVMGKKRHTWEDYYNDEYDAGMLFELERTPNRIGMCPVVFTQMPTIDRVRSHYADNYGMFIMRAKLQALEYINAERTVFSERWFIEGQQGELVAPADGRTGQIGHIRHGDLKDIQQAPHFTGTQMMDRLERDERISTGTTAEMGGESASNVRTGRRGDAIQSAAVDFTVQEVQQMLEMSKEQENKIAIAIDKTYLNKPKSIYVGFANKNDNRVDYTPKDVWETDENHVAYSHAGADINNLVIAGGQRLAQQTLSKRSFMLLDPMVEDAEQEYDAVVAEQLTASILAELLQPGGPIDIVAKAEIAKLVMTNKMELSEAIAKVQEDRQKAQATSGEPGTPEGPVDPMSPEAMPGIAPGSEAGSMIQGPTDDQANLSQLLSSLRRPQMVGPGGV